MSPDVQQPAGLLSTRSLRRPNLQRQASFTSQRR
jgi:hypothetical protein